MFLTRALEIINKEGYRTFKYALGQKIRDGISDEDAYQSYIKKIEPLRTAHEYPETAIDDYVVVCGKDMKLAAGYKKVLAGYISAAARAGKEYDFIYGDMDELSDGGKRSHPDCKPDYSPDTILSFDYIGGVYAVRRKKYDEGIAVLNELTGNQKDTDSYALALAILSCCEIEKVGHVNYILSHRVKGKMYCENKHEYDAYLKKKLLQTKDIKAHIINDKSHADVTHVHYSVSASDKISIIIPSKDNPQILGCCLESIQKYTFNADYEIIVVDNGSSEKNKALYEELLENMKVETRYIYEKRDFNFSYMCNTGAGNATGNLLLFLNDDIEITGQDYDDTDWLTVLAGQAKQEKTGAVGAKLLYTESSYIQHIGVVNYETSCFAHLYAKAVDNKSIKAYRNIADYDCLCVTGACFMLEKKKYDEAGGFDESLVVTHNDVDICLSLYEAGYYNVLRNDVVLYHHESFSRGDDEIDEDKNKRNMLARERTYSNHPGLEKYDPFYSPLLTQIKNDYGFNQEIYSVIYRRPERINMQRIYSDNELSKTVKITECGYHEDIQLRGFAYNGKKVYYNPVILLYNQQECYKIKAKSICDRVFHLRKGVTQNINFAPFYCGIDTTDMAAGRYNIAIRIEGRYYDSKKNFTIV